MGGSAYEDMCHACGGVGVVAGVGGPAWTVEVIQARKGAPAHDLLVEFEAGRHVAGGVPLHGDVKQGYLLCYEPTFVTRTFPSTGPWEDHLTSHVIWGHYLAYVSSHLTDHMLGHMLSHVSSHSRSCR